MKRRDIHAHSMPLEAFGAAGRWGPELTRDEANRYTLRSGSMRYTLPVNMPVDRLTEPGARLIDMDRSGVDIHIISSGPVFYLYGIEGELAVSWTRAVNDAMAQWCRAAPTRYYFMANLPFADIKASLAELDRVKALGARGIGMGAPILGRSLDHEYFWPIYERLNAYDMPVFMHPVAPGMDKDQGDRVKDEKMNFSSRAALDAWTGYLHEETHTTISLIMSGVFDTYPNLKFCITHGGGAVPYQFERFEVSARAHPGSSRARRELRSYLKNIYFDCIVHDVRARRLLVEFMGADNVLVGSNYAGWDEFDGFKAIGELDLAPADRDKIMGGNAARIFNIK
jgi:aminocarboxymuconate-semialdehyde decarboxylase